MPKGYPKVSIGLPVHNGENYLDKAIQSVLNQTYTNFELIISDNDSTDNTAVICQKYAEQDDRIRYYKSAENLGAAWNFNHVFELARGEYFKWLSHDDLIASVFLERCVTILDNDQDMVLCYTGVQFINEDDEVIEDYDIHLNCNLDKPYLRLKSVMLDYHLCFEVFGLIRSKALKQTGQVIGSYGHGDGILLERLSLIGRFYEVPEILFFSRKHANQSMARYGYLSDSGTNYHNYTIWFDPSKKGKLFFPTWKIVWESYRSLWLIPISSSDRLMGHFYILKLIRGRWRLLVHDLEYGLHYFYRRVTTKLYYPFRKWRNK